MVEERYSNREIDRILVDMKGQLDRIEAQTTKTNGRTTRNEQEIIKLNTKINASILTAGVMLPVICSLIVWIFLDQVHNLERVIPDVVLRELQEYEFEIYEGPTP